MIIQIKYLGDALRNDKPLKTTASRLINKISSLKDSNSNIHKYFDDELNALEISKVEITLEYDKNLSELYSTIFIHMKVDPSEKQLELLVEETTGQLSDGYGEEPWFLKSIMGKIYLHLIGMGGTTPLSIKKGLKKSDFIVEKESSSKLDVINQNGQTQLTEAIYLNRDKLALKLIKKGADANLTNPLTAACQKSVLEIAKKLIEKGADVNEVVHDVKDGTSATPLMWASNRGNLKILEALIKNGAMVNFKNATGRTALFYSRTPEVTEFLIQAGADTSLLDNNSESAKQFAQQMLKDELKSKWREDEKVDDFKKIIQILENEEKTN